MFLNNRKLIFYIAAVININCFKVYSTNNIPSFEEENEHKKSQVIDYFYQIKGCSRTIQSTDQNKPQWKNIFSHCYIKIDAKDGRVIDSRGFFADSGSVQEPELVEITETCRVLKTNATLSDWQEVVKVYDQYNELDYNLTAHNCCTVANEAANRINSKDNFFRTVNSGIGTMFKISQKKKDEIKN